MAQGSRSLVAFWVGGAGKPVATSTGARSLLAMWAGGGGNKSASAKAVKSLAAFWVGGAASQTTVPPVSLVLTLYAPTVVVPVSPPTKSLTLATLAPAFVHTLPIYDIGSGDYGQFPVWTSSGTGSVGVKVATINSTISLTLNTTSTKWKGRVTNSSISLVLGTSSGIPKSVTKSSIFALTLGTFSTGGAGLNQSRTVDSTLSLQFNLTSNVSIYKFFNTGTSRYLRSARRLTEPSQKYSRG